MNFRDRLEQSREKLGSNSEAVIAAEMEEGFICEYFAIDNIKNLPACLDLRLPSGKRKAIPYSLFAEMDFDMERGIEIITANKKITISGRDLDKLFDYLTAFRVRYIQVHIGSDLKESELFVKEIIIEENTD